MACTYVNKVLPAQNSTHLIRSIKFQSMNNNPFTSNLRISKSLLIYSRTDPMPWMSLGFCQTKALGAGNKREGVISVDELKWLTFVTEVCKILKKCLRKNGSSLGEGTTDTRRTSNDDKLVLPGSRVGVQWCRYMVRTDRPASVLHSKLSIATGKDQPSRRQLSAVDAKWLTATLTTLIQNS
jgi:hypothetical protein